MRVYGEVLDRNMLICRPIYKDSQKRFAPIAIITHRENEFGEWEYIITPVWYNYDSGLVDLDFDGISGVDCINNRKEEYIYFEKVPAIIEKRIPPKNRVEQLILILRSLGLDYYDPIDMLTVTKGISIDKNVFLRLEDKKRYIEKDKYEEGRVDIGGFNFENAFNIEDSKIDKRKYLFFGEE